MIPLVIVSLLSSMVANAALVVTNPVLTLATRNPSGGITSMGWTNDGYLLATYNNSLDSTLRLWNPKSTIPASLLALSTQPNPSNFVSTLNGQLFSTGKIIYRMLPRRPIEVFQSLPSVVTCLLAGQNNVLYAGTRTGRVYKWDLINGTKLWERIYQPNVIYEPVISESMTKPVRPITALLEDADKNILYVGNAAGLVQGLSTDTAVKTPYAMIFILNSSGGSSFFQIDEEAVRALALNSKGRLYAAIGKQIWVSDEKKQNFYVYERQNRYHHDDLITDIKIQDNFLFSASRDHTVKQWKHLDESIDLEHMATYKGHSDVVRTIQVKDGFIYSGSMDGTIKKWEVAKVDNTVNEDQEKSNPKSDQFDSPRSEFPNY